MKHTLSMILISITFCLLILVSIYPVTAEDVVITYYYDSHSTCGSCIQRNEIMSTVEQNYTGRITVIWKDYYNNASIREEANELGLLSFPSGIINGETLIPRNNITEEHLNRLIEEYLARVPEEPDLVGGVPMEILLITGAVLALVGLGLVAVLVWKKEHK